MRSWTDEQFIEAFNASNNIRQILTRLGLAPAGGNYKQVNDTINRLGLDKSKLIGQGWSKGKVFGPRQPLEYYLVNGRHTTSHSLKLRLIKENIFQHKCYNCNLDTWQGKPIPLELEHKDGNHVNNELTNLTLLCPNCHAQTDTYRGKNIKRAGVAELEYADGLKPSGFGHAGSNPVTGTYCKDCQKPISRNATRCKSCKAKSQPLKIIWPSNTELLEMLNASNYTQVAKTLGVSDNAIRKRLKK